MAAMLIHEGAVRKPPWQSIEGVPMWRRFALLGLTCLAVSVGAPALADESAACREEVEAAEQRFSERALADRTQKLAELEAAHRSETEQLKARIRELEASGSPNDQGAQIALLNGRMAAAERTLKINLDQLMNALDRASQVREEKGPE
jgi:hypothetical protein